VRSQEQRETILEIRPGGAVWEADITATKTADDGRRILVGGKVHRRAKAGRQS
jgi:hypothetical protein